MTNEIDLWASQCRLTKVRVVKSLRLDVVTAINFLQKFLQLKDEFEGFLLYLWRDPRAVHHSIKKKASTWPARLTNVENICQQMLNSINDVKNHCSKTSERFKVGTISYEAVVLPNVTSGLQTLLKALGFPITCNTWQFLAKHTYSSIPMTCEHIEVTTRTSRRELEENSFEYYDTVRDHRSFNPNSWMLEASQGQERNMSSVCASVVSMVGKINHTIC